MIPARKPGKARSGRSRSGKAEEKRRRKGPEVVALTTEELEDLISELETRLDRLRALYDMYFMGIEKLEPNVQKKDVERRIHDLRREQIRNTGLRFRFNMLVQRYNTMLTYWLRVSRAIEEGRYRRDVMRARERLLPDSRLRRKRRREEEIVELDESDIETVEEDAALGSLSGVETGAPLPVDRPAQTSGAASGGLVFRRPRSDGAVTIPRRSKPRDDDAISESRLREIYARYLEVRKECKESTKNVRFEKMAKAVRGMLPELKKKAGGRKVDFEVTIKNGKAFLKPVAR